MSMKKASRRPSENVLSSRANNVDKPHRSQSSDSVAQLLNRAADSSRRFEFKSRSSR